MVLFQQHKQLRIADKTPAILTPAPHLSPFLFCSPLPPSYYSLLIKTNPDISIDSMISAKPHLQDLTFHREGGIFLKKDNCLRIPVPAVGHPFISILSTPASPSFPFKGWYKSHFILLPSKSSKKRENAKLITFTSKI